MPAGSLILPAGVRPGRSAGQLRLQDSATTSEIELHPGAVQVIDLPPGRVGLAEIEFRDAVLMPSGPASSRWKSAAGWAASWWISATSRCASPTGRTRGGRPSRPGSVGCGRRWTNERVRTVRRHRGRARAGAHRRPADPRLLADDPLPARARRLGARRPRRCHRARHGDRGAHARTRARRGRPDNQRRRPQVEQGRRGACYHCRRVARPPVGGCRGRTRRDAIGGPPGHGRPDGQARGSERGAPTPPGSRQMVGRRRRPPRQAGRRQGEPSPGRHAALRGERALVRGSRGAPRDRGVTGGRRRPRPATASR